MDMSARQRAQHLGGIDSFREGRQSIADYPCSGQLLTSTTPEVIAGADELLTIYYEVK